MSATNRRRSSRPQPPFDLQAFLATRTAGCQSGAGSLFCPPPPPSRPPSTRRCATRFLPAANGCAPPCAWRPPPPAAATKPHALPLACAVECIHTYSLVHDDLPGDGQRRLPARQADQPQGLWRRHRRAGRRRPADRRPSRLPPSAKAGRAIRTRQIILELAARRRFAAS